MILYLGNLHEKQFIVVGLRHYGACDGESGVSTCIHMGMTCSGVSGKDGLRYPAYAISIHEFDMIFYK
jgi:hypothetical protein